jgi:hypothetical protein
MVKHNVITEDFVSTTARYQTLVEAIAGIQEYLWDDVPNGKTIDRFTIEDKVIAVGFYTSENRYIVQEILGAKHVLTRPV